MRLIIVNRWIYYDVQKEKINEIINIYIDYIVSLN